MTCITLYLVMDAIFIALLSVSVILAFLPADKSLRLMLLVRFRQIFKSLNFSILQSFAVPSLALAMCSWGSIFEFYLRLEERQRRRSDAVQKILLRQQNSSSKFTSVREFAFEQ